MGKIMELFIIIVAALALWRPIVGVISLVGYVAYCVVTK